MYSVYVIFRNLQVKIVDKYCGDEVFLVYHIMQYVIKIMILIVHEYYTFYVYISLYTLYPSYFLFILHDILKLFTD
jgi:hypothetical protein